MRMIVAGIILMALGLGGVAATIIQMVLTFQELKAAGGTPTVAMFSHGISIAVIFSLIGAPLFTLGIVLLILGAIRRHKSQPQGFAVTPNA